LPDTVEKERYNTRQQSRLKKVIKYRLSRNKVIVVGDSHARGCAEDLTALLRQNFQVTGNVKPGANTSQIVKSPNGESSNATKKNHIVLWTGSNDVSKSNTNEGLNGIEEYEKEYKDTNIIVTGIPQRYDLSPTSCVNFEVQKFKRKLKKLCSSFRLYNCTGCVGGVVNAIEVGCLPLSQHLLARTEDAKKRHQTAACVPTIECWTFGKGRRENHWTGTIVLDLFVETFKKIVIQIIQPSILASSC
jgi:hypothetical protein